MKAVRFAATMKATALNIIRAAAYKKRRNKGSKPLPSSFRGVFGLIRVIKELFFENSGKMANVEAVMTEFCFF
jgi:hypothetical protein